MSPLLLSVVMPVYNGAAYLERAIDSILCQTCGDYEFIIINDGSTDESAADHSRIRRFSYAILRTPESGARGNPEQGDRDVKGEIPGPAGSG